MTIAWKGVLPQHPGSTDGVRVGCSASERLDEFLQSACSAHVKGEV